jgi:rhamnose utilization protein RhaD (predicted bifunctional aldolase and dehydrogenase)
VTELEELIELSRTLGDTGSDYVILAEGNVSALTANGSMLVKASGASLADATTDSFVDVRLDAMLDVLDGSPADEGEQAAALLACVAGDKGASPSVEAPLHAVAIRHGSARVVGHTHPIAVNAILCSGNAELITRALFPDQIVVCGADPLLVPYVDPGLPLARIVRQRLLERAYPPKVIYLQNHGLVALGQTAQEVVQITEMAAKAAAILLGALGAGGPVFLPDEEVARIDGRPDEHYRREALARSQPK